MMIRKMTHFRGAAVPGTILSRARGMAIGAPPPPPPQDVASGTPPPPPPQDMAGGTPPPPPPQDVAGGKDQNKGDRRKYLPNVNTEQIGTVAFMTLFIYYYNEARQNTTEQIKNLHLVYDKEHLLNRVVEGKEVQLELMKKVEEGKQEQMELRARLEKLEEEKRKMAEEMLVAETRLQELQTRVAEKERRSYRFWPLFGNK